MSVALAVPGKNLIEVRETCRLLVECERLDEAKEIRDKAAALQNYLGKRTEEALNAAEIKVRAERRLGQLLDPNKERRGSKLNSRGGSSNPLPRGVTHKQSATWKGVARVQADRFETYITDRRQAGLEITTAGVLRLLPVETEVVAPTEARPSTESNDGEVCTTPGACGPITDADKALHIWAFTENFYAVKDYDVGGVVQQSTKKSIKELSSKVEQIQRWLTALQGAMRERLK